MQAIRLLLILGLMGVATPSFSAEFKTIRLADRTRINYAIALPPGFDPTIAYPLLLALPLGRQDDRMVLAGLDSYWEHDLPPSEWSRIFVILAHEGVWKW
ncbi:MAG: hypothetical protein O2995_12825, partial [Proteobacteria bacterium]|nr:hypothetical protein [Pseudomonadota bacterium]